MKYINFYIFIFFSISLLTAEKKESKYKGNWPTNNIDKKVIKSNILPLCPHDIGCTCTNNSDCTNNNCIKIPRGSYCFPSAGDYFPDFKGIDQFDEVVDIYDFSNQNKYILIEWLQNGAVHATYFLIGSHLKTRKFILINGGKKNII